MNDLFPGLGNALASYFQSADYGALAFWGYILTPVLIIWMVAKGILMSSAYEIKGESQRSVFQRVFNIHRNIILAAALVGMGVIALYVYFWVQDHYKTNALQLSHLLSLSLCLSISLFTLISLRGLISRGGIRDFIRSPMTRNEEEDLQLLARRAFSRVRLFVLLPLLGFSVLFLLQSRKHNLVSFILDNSSSMEMSNEYFGDAPIETGEVALRRTVRELDQWTDVIISTFEEDRPGKNYKSAIEEIMAAREMTELTGTHQFFLGTEKASTQAYINTLSESITGSTPLCETIWSNYLFTRGKVADDSGLSYLNVVSIIITDGGESETGDIDGFLCEQPDFAEFFVPDNVNIINLGEGANPPFMEKAEACGYHIWEGYNPDLFNASLNEILAAFKSDWNFVLWLIIVYFVFLAIHLLVVPKRTI